MMKSLNIGNPECKRTLALQDAYLSNELSVETTAAIARHLERCRQCQSDFQAMELVRNRLQDAVASDPVPPELVRKVIRAVRQAEASSEGSCLTRWFRRCLGGNGRLGGNK